MKVNILAGNGNINSNTHQYIVDGNRLNLVQCAHANAILFGHIHLLHAPALVGHDTNSGVDWYKVNPTYDNGVASIQLFPSTSLPPF